MKTRKTVLIVLALLWMSLLASCVMPGKAQPSTADAMLLDTEWVLISQNGTAPIAGKPVTLRFGEAELEGSAGCNTYGGTYTVTNDELTVGDVYRTEMACSEPEGIMEQENAYFEMLNATVSYQVENAQLSLIDASGATLLVFEAEATQASNPPASSSFAPRTLWDTEWELIALNGIEPIAGQAVTLRFDDAEFNGSAGCNTYGGTYTVTDDNVTLSDVYWTEMACSAPEGILEQEIAYFEALNNATRYQLENDRLSLYDAAGAKVLVYIASGSSVETMRNTQQVYALDCSLDMDETYAANEPVTLTFMLSNPSDRQLYVLSWYTPLEGMAGDILQVTRDGTKLPYQGMLVKRSDPSRDEYIAIAPGETISAEADLRTGYDLSTPGSYQVQLTVGLQDVTDDDSLIPQQRGNHQPQSMSCNTLEFNVDAASESATVSSESQAGFRRYVNGTSGVALWVPEDWTVIEPGTSAPILQSYPQDKYVGGEARQPGDTKCDLFIHPADVTINDVLPQEDTQPPTTIISEQEITLQSGALAKRYELDNLGRFLSLITDVNGRVVVFSCFGESEQFDDIAMTLGVSE